MLLFGLVIVGAWVDVPTLMVNDCVAAPALFVAVRTLAKVGVAALVAVPLYLAVPVAIVRKC